MPRHPTFGKMMRGYRGPSMVLGSQSIDAAEAALYRGDIDEAYARLMGAFSYGDLVVVADTLMRERPHIPLDMDVHCRSRTVRTMTPWDFCQRIEHQDIGHRIARAAVYEDRVARIIDVPLEPIPAVTMDGGVAAHLFVEMVQLLKTVPRIERADYKWAIDDCALSIERDTGRAPDSAVVWPDFVAVALASNLVHFTARRVNGIAEMVWGKLYDTRPGGLRAFKVVK